MNGLRNQKKMSSKIKWEYHPPPGPASSSLEVNVQEKWNVGEKDPSLEVLREISLADPMRIHVHLAEEEENITNNSSFAAIAEHSAINPMRAEIRQRVRAAMKKNLIIAKRSSREGIFLPLKGNFPVSSLEGKELAKKSCGSSNVELVNKIVQKILPFASVSRQVVHDPSFEWLGTSTEPTESMKKFIKKLCSGAEALIEPLNSSSNLLNHGTGPQLASPALACTKNWLLEAKENLREALSNSDFPEGFIENTLNTEPNVSSLRETPPSLWWSARQQELSLGVPSLQDALKVYREENKLNIIRSEERSQLQNSKAESWYESIKASLSEEPGGGTDEDEELTGTFVKEGDENTFSNAFHLKRKRSRR